jgi:Ca2+-binding EF-hand superfamily protein
MFDTYDINHDGILDKAEMRDAFASLVSPDDNF